MYTSSTVSECALITILKEIKQTKNKNYIVFFSETRFFGLTFITNVRIQNQNLLLGFSLNKNIIDGKNK